MTGRSRQSTDTIPTPASSHRSTFGTSEGQRLMTHQRISMPSAVNLNYTCPSELHRSDLRCIRALNGEIPSLIGIIIIWAFYKAAGILS